MKLTEHLILIMFSGLIGFVLNLIVYTVRYLFWGIDYILTDLLIFPIYFTLGMWFFFGILEPMVCKLKRK